MSQFLLLQGSSIIRMLEGFVGREKFKEGLSVCIICEKLQEFVAIFLLDLNLINWIFLNLEVYFTFC